MVNNNWLSNNGQAMDTQATFLCGATSQHHPLSAARGRYLLPVLASRPVGDPASPRRLAILG